MNPIPGAAARQIYLIQPKFPISYWGLEHFLPLTPYQAIFPPLGLLTLAALTPPDFDVTLLPPLPADNVDEDADDDKDKDEEKDDDEDNGKEQDEDEDS